MRAINSADDLEFHGTRTGGMEKMIPTTPWSCSSNGSQNKATMNDFAVQREMVERRRQTYVYLLLLLSTAGGGDEAMHL